MKFPFTPLLSGFPPPTMSRSNKKPFSLCWSKTCHPVLYDLELVLLGKEATGNRDLFSVQNDSRIDRCHLMMTFKGGRAP